MIVTDKKYMIEDQLLIKLNLMIKRLKGTDDIVLLIDGDEGQGKTEFAIGICYYMSYKLKRKYTINNIFFNLDEILHFAANTKNQIIHFDEAALGLLRTQWQKEIQQKFIQLVMVARKKRHFIVICIPKFHRLPPYLTEDRSIGLIHVYSHNNINKGRYCYFTKSAKEKLNKDYNKSKIKSYRKHFSFRGKFVEASPKVFTKKQMEEYNKKKDKAILSVSEKKKLSPTYKTWLEQRNILINYLKENEALSQRALSERLGELGIDLKKTALVDVLRSARRITI